MSAELQSYEGEQEESETIFFSRIDRSKYVLVWEPRGKWKPKEIEFVCRKVDLVHAVDPFKCPSLYGEIFYYRLHGRGELRYKYTGEDLKHLNGMFSGEKDGYVMFNNLYMFGDAVAFKELVG